MTNTNDNIQSLLTQLAQSQLRTQAQVERNTELIGQIENQLLSTQRQLMATSNQAELLTNQVERVLARSAILDDVLLELRDGHEEMRRNFNEHQRSTNAALERLEAILMRLTRNDN